MTCIARRNEPPMLHGTLTTFRRRCGKPACHCADGAPHESPALTFNEQGRTKTVTLGDAELAWARRLGALPAGQRGTGGRARDGLAALRSGREQHQR